MPPYNTDDIDPDSCSNMLIENYSGATTVLEMMPWRSNQDGTSPVFNSAYLAKASWFETQPPAVVVASQLVVRSAVEWRTSRSETVTRRAGAVWV